MDLLPLWKGESFDQYDPHGKEARWCPDSHKVRRKLEKRNGRPGAESLIKSITSLQERREAVLVEVKRARVAYRAIHRGGGFRTGPRTIVACLIPPTVLLSNSAPYLTFINGDEETQAACLGVMNSLPFDWQARCFVERNINFFILEGLKLPDLHDEDYKTVAKAAARLSAVDERFSEFAQAVGVDVGPLSDEEGQRLRVEIDALVARAWDLTADDLELMFTDFTLNAVPLDYRKSLLARLEELS